MSANDPIVIVSAMRTPMGGFMGALSGVATPELGATAIKAAVEKAGLASDQVDEVIMGCVLPAGLKQAPARQAALGADLALVYRLYNNKQGLWLWYESGNDGSRFFSCRCY